MQSSESTSECARVREELERVAEEIRKCSRCPLSTTRINAVPGEGDPCSRIVFIGEAPGSNEDQQGRPFVGSAGQLLNSLLHSIGVPRESVFITNVVKCRPPANRDPRDEEIQACLPYLVRQLELIKPRLIVTLGRHSTRTLLSLYGYRAESIMSVRGKVFKAESKWGQLTIYPTLHPAAALYNPRLKALLEEDFQRISTLIKSQASQGQSSLDMFFR